MFSTDQHRRQHSLWWRALPFIAPSLAVLLVFVFLAVTATFGISFTQWRLPGSPHFTGISNYIRLAQDPYFANALRNTVLFTALSVPAGVLLAVLLALLVNRPLPGISVFRTIYFIPVVTPVVALAVVWTWVYDTDFGLLNWALSAVGLPRIAWLGEHWVISSLALMAIWRGLGFNMVICLAGLRAIPRTYYEAARMDGAGAWQGLRYITLPLLSPTLFFLFVMGVVASAQVFDQVYVMTQGGPLHASEVVVYSIYHTAFERHQLGYAAAQSYVLFALILTFTLLQFRFQKRWVHYQTS